MIIQSKFILFLKCIQGITDSMIRKLINSGKLDQIDLKNQEQVLSWLKLNLSSSKNFDPYVLTINDINMAKVKRKQIELTLSKIGGGYLSYYDESYPNCFKKMEKDYPIILFYKGDISLLKYSRICAVIGTRNPSEETKKIGADITKALVKKDFVIVGGLALGCDTIGHKVCIENSGKTIAILGTGIDKIYPKENASLLNDILNRDGLIISEEMLGFSGATYSFVKRDRLQAALSNIVIALETAIDGGTMHASKCASTKYKRKLITINPMLLPNGNITGNIELHEKYDAEYICNVEDLEKYI